MAYARSSIASYHVQISLLFQLQSSDFFFDLTNLCSFHFSNSKALKSLGLVSATAVAPSSSSSASPDATGLYGLVVLGHTSGPNFQFCEFELQGLKSSYNSKFMASEFCLIRGSHCHSNQNRSQSQGVEAAAAAAAAAAAMEGQHASSSN